MQRWPGVFALLLSMLAVQPLAAQSPTPQPFDRAHRAVTTQNADAQAAFDKGLTLLYAFNPEAARRAFDRAAHLDPQLAMAEWGIAMSYGPNINTPFNARQAHLGSLAIATAKSLATSASPVERALIDAAAKRYAYAGASDEDRSARAFADAMRAVAQAYPTDDDVQTLTAEAEMDETPWAYWSSDGQPGAPTLDIIGRLREVLAREPNHIGANHYLIHALEESPHPGDALDAAGRLAAMHFEPAAEHLTHMPAHIFVHVGKYEAAGIANERAIASLKTYLEDGADDHRGYLSHDCLFGVYAFMMAGDYARAKAIAAACDDSVESAMVDYRFARWTNLADSGLELGRGAADVSEGKLADADRLVHELARLRDARGRIATLLLTARIAASRGDETAQIKALRTAVAVQDSSGYREPPEWWFPVRESLGGALYRAGKYAEAEAVFRADLERNPGNPRSLFGLSKTLEREGKLKEADAVQHDFTIAWADADSDLTMKEL